MSDVISDAEAAEFAHCSNPITYQLSPPMPQGKDEGGSYRKRGDEAVRSRQFKLVPFEAIKPDLVSPYLIKGLLQSTGLVVVWGPPKCGKSFWISDVLLHVALGREYRGRRVAPGPVIYCALEGEQGFKNRIEAFRRTNLSKAEVQSPPFYLMAAPLSLARDVEALVADVRKQLGDKKPAAVCIDTLNRSLAGSENSDEDMGAYIRSADAIRDAFDCLVVIVHHCGHNGERPRGHSSLGGAVDSQISIKRDARDNIIAELELSKDSAVGLQFVSRLKVVEIGLDEDGDPVTSCVIESIDGHQTPTSTVARRLPNGAQTALRALNCAIAEVGEEPPRSNYVPLGVRAVSLERWRNYAYRDGISDSSEPRARQTAFKRAYETLINRRHVAAWEDYRWPTNQGSQ